MFEERLAEERRRTDLELLKREHRFINATLALGQSWNAGEDYRWAAIEGFVRCLAVILFRTGMGASVAGVGMAGLFFAYQANRLVQEQTIRINIQSHLTEAQRRSTLIFELGQIMEGIAKEKNDPIVKPTKRQDHYRSVLKSILDSGQIRDQLITDYIESQFTPSDALVGRIAALSTSLRPYYYVNYAHNTAGTVAKPATGIAAFLDELTRVTLQAGDDYYPRLIDEPVSPERGQLLLYLLSSGVDLLPVGDSGATFEGADLQGSQLYGFFLPSANLTNAKFQQSVFSTVQFGSINPTLGVQLDRADFTCATFRNTVFASATMVDAKFAFVRMNNFNFVDSKSSQLSFGSANLGTADLTDADFSGTFVTREEFPWAFSPPANGAQPIPRRDFVRSEWRLEKVDSLDTTREVFQMFRRSADIDYNDRRSKACVRDDTPSDEEAAKLRWSFKQ